MSLVPANNGSDSMSQRTGGEAMRMPVRVAGEDRGQVEAKAVHMHLADPVTKAVHDQPPADDSFAFSVLPQPV